MKRTLLALLFLGLSTVSATAEDGVISNSNLGALGLGEMKAMSAEEGMQVRGLSSSSRSASSSSFVITIVDPFSGSSITQSAGQNSVGTDENAGAAAAAATAASSATTVGATAQTQAFTTGASTFTATLQAISVSTLGAARGATVATPLTP